MSRTRARAATKVNTPSQMWARLNARERAVVMCAGTEEPIGAPHAVIQSLVDWWILVPRARGHVLTVWGMQVREHGRGESNATSARG